MPSSRLQYMLDVVAHAHGWVVVSGEGVLIGCESHCMNRIVVLVCVVILASILLRRKSSPAIHESPTVDLDLATIRGSTSLESVLRNCRCRGYLHALDFAGNSSTMWSLLDCGQDRCDNINHSLLVHVVTIVESGLHNVVGERIPEHALQFVAQEQFVDHQRFGLRISYSDAFLNDVGAELLLGECSNFAREASAKGSSVFNVVQVKYVLHDVIAIRILNQVKCAACDSSN